MEKNTDVRDELSRISGSEVMISDPWTFLSQVTFVELPEQVIAKDQGNTIPKVLNRTRIHFTNSAPISVTNFTQGQDGQELKILGDGNTTLVYGVYIKTNTGINKLLVTNKVYSFTCFDQTWIENA